MRAIADSTRGLSLVFRPASEAVLSGALVGGALILAAWLGSLVLV